MSASYGHWMDEAHGQIARETRSGKSYAIKIERMDRVVIRECSGVQVVVLLGD